MKKKTLFLFFNPLPTWTAETPYIPRISAYRNRDRVVTQKTKKRRTRKSDLRSRLPWKKLSATFLDQSIDHKLVDLRISVLTRNESSLFTRGNIIVNRQLTLIKRVSRRRAYGTSLSKRVSSVEQGPLRYANTFWQSFQNVTRQRSGAKF